MSSLKQYTYFTSLSKENAQATPVGRRIWRIMFCSRRPLNKSLHMPVTDTHPIPYSTAYERSALYYYQCCTQMN